MDSLTEDEQARKTALSEQMSRTAKARHRKTTAWHRTELARNLAVTRWQKYRADNGLSDEKPTPLVMPEDNVPIHERFWSWLLLSDAPGEKPPLDTYLRLKLVLQIIHELWRGVKVGKRTPIWTQTISNTELAELLGCTPKAVAETVDYLAERGILAVQEVARGYRYALRVNNWQNCRTERKAS